MSTDKLLSGNRTFRDNTFTAERDRFVRLAEEGQRPSVLWIGCSDSRVIPEQITGAPAGELFVVRNVANVVPPAGAGGDAVGAAVECAINHLQVSDVIICGHTDCGGIKALDRGVNMARDPHIARWLELARPARTQVEISAGSEGDRHAKIVAANVLLQKKNLYTYPCVRAAADAHALTVHCWLYDVHSGGLAGYDERSGRWEARTGTSAEAK